MIITEEEKEALERIISDIEFGDCDEIRLGIAKLKTVVKFVEIKK